VSYEYEINKIALFPIFGVTMLLLKSRIGYPRNAGNSLAALRWTLENATPFKKSLWAKREKKRQIKKATTETVGLVRAYVDEPLCR
jgi:hypothetical protein